jgi:putative membrane protein
MHAIAVVAAVLAALVHVYIFVIESVWFMRPAVWSRFGLTSPEEARVVRSFAYNQGWYNLFLAAGVAVGLALVGTGHTDAGRAIVIFACASMSAAGIILVQHNRAFARAAAIQAGPPAVAIAAALLIR